MTLLRVRRVHVWRLLSRLLKDRVPWEATEFESIVRDRGIFYFPKIALDLIRFIVIMQFFGSTYEILNFSRISNFP